MLSRIIPTDSRTIEMIKNTLLPVPQHLSSRHIQVGQSGLEVVKSALLRHYFRKFPSGYLETELGVKELDAHLLGRLQRARREVIPWLDHFRSIAGTNILEIGCGTGSDAIAFAEQGANVTAVDIDEDSLAAARERCHVYDLRAAFLKANATEVPDLLRGEPFDLIVFYASLEHMTHEERMRSLSGTWNMLGPNGLWCVIETPNRLWLRDDHSSLLPFFHWLPDDLAFEYSRFSPRANFSECYRDKDATAILDFLRRGRGVSFHEFDLAIRRVDELKVLSSMSIFNRQRSPIYWLHWRFSAAHRYETLLATMCPQIHRGFFQEELDLIIERD